MPCSWPQILGLQARFPASKSHAIFATAHSCLHFPKHLLSAHSDNFLKGWAPLWWCRELPFAQAEASGQFTWDAREGLNPCHPWEDVGRCLLMPFSLLFYSGKGGKLLELQFRQEKLTGNCIGQEMDSQRRWELHEDLENEQDWERMAVFGFLVWL